MQEPRTPIDYEDARKKRQRAYKRKQFFLLLFIVLLVLTILYVNDWLVQKNATSQIGEFIDSIGGTGYPIRSPGGIIQTTDSLGRNLLVMNDTNLYVYNPKGKRILNVQQVSEHSVVKTNSDRALLYHQGDRRFTVLSATTELHTEELEDGIVVADMGKGGDLVVVTAARQFTANIMVFDPDFKHVMTRRSTSDRQVSAVSISPKGDYIVVGDITTDNGVIQSIITLYHSKNGEEIAYFTLPEQFVLDVKFQSEQSFSVLTDSQFSVYSLESAKAGTNNGVYHFPAGYALEGFETNGTETLLFHYDKHSGREEMALLNGKAELLGLLPPTEPVKDAVLSDKYLYILLPTGVERYNYDLEAVEFTETQGVVRMERVRDTIYLFTKDEIQELGGNQ